MNTGRIRLLVTFPLLCALALLVSATAFGAEVVGPRLMGRTPAGQDASLAATQPYVPGEVIVQFKSGMSAVAVRSTHQRTGSVRTRAFPAFKGLEVARIASGKDVMATVRAYEAMPEVAYAQPNYIHQLAYTTPNDTLFEGYQWALRNTGSWLQPPGQPAAIAGSDIDADEAWDVTKGSSSVVVAVVDSGIDLYHPDLKNNLWVNTDEIAGNGLDDDSNGYVDDRNGYDTYNNDSDPFDDYVYGHGTHVAGIIGAEGNNGRGVAGVNWDVSLLAVKAGGSDGSLNTGSILGALEYIKTTPARVINCSFGGASFDTAQYNAMRAMPEYLFVCAAGNSGQSMDVANFYPAGFDLANILSVGSSTDRDERASSSNYSATKVDVFAPGQSIANTVASPRRLVVASDATLTTIYSDSFSTLGNWGNNAVTVWKADGTWMTSAPFAAANTSYGNGQTNELWLVPDMNLSTLSRPGMSFKLKLDTEAGYDFVEWGVWDASSNTYTEYGAISGENGEFQEVAADLSAHIGQPDIHPWFRFVIDGDTGYAEGYAGVWIDDFKVFNVTPGPSGLAFDYAQWEEAPYALMTGTSMAAPHASGVAALMLARNSSLTAATLKAAIMDSVDVNASLTGLCVKNGRINAFTALKNVNRPPVALPEVFVTDEDVRVQLTPILLANDSDPDGDRLSLQGIGFSGGSGGWLGSPVQLYYTPPLNESGEYTFTYAVKDSCGVLSNIAMATIIVNDVNDLPATTADSYETPVGVTLVVPDPGVLANDSDVESALRATVSSGPQHGDLTLQESGGFTYVPDAGYVGIDEFRYTASDDSGGQTSQTVSINVKSGVRVSGLQVRPAGTDYLHVSWEPIPGADWYSIFANGVPRANRSTPGGLLTGLAPNTEYTIIVTWTADGSHSLPSEPVSARTWAQARGLEETDAQFAQSGPWLTWSHPLLSGGAYTYLNSAGSSSITFDGTGLTLWSRKGPEFGVADVYIDGVKSDQIDLYSLYASQLSDSVYSTPVLAPGTHTVRVAWTGQKNPSATNTYINIDAADLAPVAPGPIASPAVIQESDAFVVTSGLWTPFSTTDYSGNSYAFANSAGTGKTISFSGTRLDLIARTGPEFGFAKVTIDGVSRYIDLYSATTKYQQSVFSTWDLPDGEHTVRVEWTGRKNPASSGTYVNVDAFKIAGASITPPVAYQETDAAFDFAGSWGTWSNAALSGGAYAYSNASGAITRVSFEGSHIDLYARTGPEFGIASVSLDGGPAQTIDLFSATPSFQQKVYSADVTPDRAHTVSIGHTGTKNGSATGTYINVDAAEVMAAAPPAISGQTRVEQDDSRLAPSGAWSSWSASGLSVGSYAYTNTPGAQTTALFFGTRLDIIARTGPEFGYLKVTIDGAETRYVDLYSKATAYQQRVYSTWLRDGGQHLVRMEWSGRKNPASSGTYVNLDALEIVGDGVRPVLPYTGGTVIDVQEQQDTTATLSSGWSTWSSSALEGGKYAYTGTKDAVATLLTNNTSASEHGAVTIIARMGPEFGIARVEVDGLPVGDVNLYSPVTLWKQKVFTWRLEPGPHTITVKNTGTKDPAASGTYINVDAYKVWVPDDIN